MELSPSETSHVAASDSFPTATGGESTVISPGEVEQATRLGHSLLEELGKVILGQQDLLELVVVCLLARGHLLLEGLPGLGKTELIKALSGILGLKFRRVQFTPDLLPSDILGAPILEERDGRRQLVFHQGPLFANLVLADEINRASPKTQSALLEAMQERRATILGETYVLPQPFFVLATQNPIELEGTYPLPEAQLDRFTFKVLVPSVSTETIERIIVTRQHGAVPEIKSSVTQAQLEQLFHWTERVHLPRAIANYIARLVTATHVSTGRTPAELRQYIKFGASPRAAIALAATARAAALLAGRPNVGFEHVRRVAPSVLGHRLILDYTARLEGWDTPRVISTLLAQVPEIERPLPEDLRA